MFILIRYNFLIFFSICKIEDGLGIPTKFTKTYLLLKVVVSRNNKGLFGKSFDKLNIVKSNTGKEAGVCARIVPTNFGW
jgi:hypothetical protein